MNIRTSYVLAILAIVAAMSASSAYAQQLPCPDCGASGVETAQMRILEQIPISVWTDMETYEHGSIITVSGAVANIRQNDHVTLTVTSPLDNRVTVQQFPVNSDATFSTTINTSGELWKYDGTYTIRVQYGAQPIRNHALVEMTGGVMFAPTPSVECRADEIAVNDRHCVPFSISGGVVTSSWTTEDNSIVIAISSFEPGTLSVNPSTDIISGIFMVLVDGEEWDDVEINRNQVTVEFPAGTTEIEIIGTFVIPEFGAIAALILAVAIISIIAVSARSRLSLMPKF